MASSIIDRIHLFVLGGGKKPKTPVCLHFTFKHFTRSSEFLHDVNRKMKGKKKNKNSNPKQSRKGDFSKIQEQALREPKAPGSCFYQ